MYIIRILIQILESIKTYIHIAQSFVAVERDCDRE